MGGERSFMTAASERPSRGGVSSPRTSICSPTDSFAAAADLSPVAMTTTWVDCLMTRSSVATRLTARVIITIGPPDPLPSKVRGSTVTRPITVTMAPSSASSATPMPWTMWSRIPEVTRTLRPTRAVTTTSHPLRRAAIMLARSHPAAATRTSRGRPLIPSAAATHAVTATGTMRTSGVTACSPWPFSDRGMGSDLLEGLGTDP